MNKKNLTEHLAEILSGFRKEEKKVKKLRAEIVTEIDRTRERRESLPDDLWDRQGDLWRAEEALKEIWGEVRRAEIALHSYLNREGIAPEAAILLLSEAGIE